MDLLFLDVTLIDGDGGLREHAALLVEEGRIAAVGDTATLEAHRRRPDVRVLDLQGLTLMPGLIEPGCWSTAARAPPP